MYTESTNNLKALLKEAKDALSDAKASGIEDRIITAKQAVISLQKRVDHIERSFLDGMIE